MEFPEKLSNLLQKSGLSRKELAEKLGVSRTAISWWLSGTKEPSKDNLAKISNIFKVSLNYLLDKNVSDSGKKQVRLFEWVQAGNWSDFCQPDADAEYIDLPYGVPENCFAVRVKGNSMSRAIGPSICEGCIAFCEPVCDIYSPEELNHQVVIAQCQNMTTIKEFVNDDPCFLMPWNPDKTLYHNLPLSDDVRIIGIVRSYQYLL